MKLPSRKQVLVDHKVQWTLVRRVCMYWLSCVAVVKLMPVFLSMLTMRLAVEMSTTTQYVLSMLIPVTIFLPLIAYDVMRVSNQFVGPLYRLRRNMRELTAGETIAPIQFRPDDFWHDLADEFNALVREVQSLRDNNADAATREEDESAESLAAAVV
jgi:signal transduction histidine kinase